MTATSARLAAALTRLIDVVDRDAATGDDAAIAPRDRDCPVSSHPSRQRRATSAPPGTTPIPIQDAAARLGISLDAARKRLVRGTLAGERTPAGWTVYWTDRQDSSAPGGAPASDALVEALQARIDSLETHLAAERQAREDAERRHSVELERRDVLLREALQRVPELPAGETVQAATVTHEKAAVRNDRGDVASESVTSGSDRLALRWRRWWRRMRGGG
jgi:hypothetical protein